MSMTSNMKDNRYFVAYKISQNDSITFGMGDINMYPYRMSDFELFSTRNEFAAKLNVPKESLTIVNFQLINSLGQFLESDCHEYFLCYVEHLANTVVIKMCTVICDPICSFDDILKLRDHLANEINIDKENLVFISINPLPSCNWKGEISQYIFHF